MVDRVGDWYAFSRASFCRRLTLYENLPWCKATSLDAPTAQSGFEGDDATYINSNTINHAEPSFSLAAAEHVAVAPFGGLIAVLSSNGNSNGTDSFALASPSSSSDGAKRPYFNLSAHSAAVAAVRAISIFTNGGELLAQIPLTTQDVGENGVKTLGWTPEGELFALLEPSLTVIFMDMRDVAVEAVAESSPPSRATATTQTRSSASHGRVALGVSRRVALKSHGEIAGSTDPSASPAIAALCVTTEGVLCVSGDGSGQLYGLLHEEKFRSSVVPSVRLPLRVRRASEEEVAPQRPEVVVVRPRVTAVDMVPPAWNDSGDFVVLWAQCDETFEVSSAKGTRKLKPVNTISADSDASTLCAMVLPDGDFLDYDDVLGDDGAGVAAATDVSPTWSATRLVLPGRVLRLSVCVGDPTRLAAFTTRSVLHVLRSNLSATLYAIDLGLCRVLRDLQLSAAGKSAESGLGDDGYGAFDSNFSIAGGGGGGGGAFSQSFAFGDAPWRQRDIEMNRNPSFAVATSSSPAGAAAQTVDGGSRASSPFAGSFSPPAEGADGNNQSGAAAAKSVAVPSPYKLEWCGTNFVLLHFYQSDFQPPQPSSSYASEATSQDVFALEQRQEAPMFSLLVCTQRGCSVHCERLDWSLDGSGHVATVAEDDGVRVVTDTTCYFVQEVPTCLARLCRVQPPFSPAAQVVLAYRAYTNGDRRGIAQVRAALSSSFSSTPANASLADGGDAAMIGDNTNPNMTDNNIEDVDEVNDDDDGDAAAEMSHAEGIVYELLDAASYECDVEQQYLLVAAASFAGETIHLRSGVPDIIVDVVRRLRVLRAVREAPCCHMPLTMGQYQILTGSEERPARLLSGSEGSVLIDRLAYLGYYQLALDVVRAMHMKPNRVLARWASSFVRRHVASLQDAALHHEVTQVLRQYPAASYIEAATTAFHLGRRDLALRLLRDEPQQQRQRVMLCVRMGELTMAGRAAAASGSAELIHLVVCALVAKEAQTHREAVLAKRAAQQEQEKGGVTSAKVGEDGLPENDALSDVDGAAAAGVTAADVYHCLIASPELLCWLLIGAPCIASWQSMAQRLLLISARHWSLAALECQHMLVQCLRLTSAMHRGQLRQYMAETSSAGPGLRGGGGADREGGVNGDAGAPQQQEQEGLQQKSKRGDKKKLRRNKKKKRRHHRQHGSDDDNASGSASSSGEEDGSDDGGASDDGNGGGGAGAGQKQPTRLALPPPLSIPVPTALGAAAALTEWLHKTNGALLNGLQHAEELRREKASARPPFSVLLDKAEQLRAESRSTAAHAGDEEGTQRGSKRGKGGVKGSLSNNEEEGNSRVDNAFVFAHEQCVRTVLSTPSTPPSKDSAALQKEEELSRAKVRLAVQHNSPRLARVVSVVDLVFELSGLEDGGEEDAAEVQRTFKLPEKMFYYARLRGMCAAQRWSAVDRLLGPPPPLRKRSFFSVGEGGAAKPPCIGYLPVVQLLTSHGQEERAARYVAGACSESVDRVVLYMSLGAPVMALEAAMVDKDAGLIQQIMQRVPGSAKVQSVGTQMLNELRED